jgi:hypothetical protein
MDDDQQPSPQPSEEQEHGGPPDLILQAIVPPTDAPAEIRAAVANTLAGRERPGEPSHTWEDVSFAASAIALIEGTNQRAEPDTQWVFALSAESPRLGEQLHASGAWASTLHSQEFQHGTGRVLWRVSVFDAVTTSPRPSPRPLA